MITPGCPPGMGEIEILLSPLLSIEKSGEVFRRLP
jgi:hypothetical protein